jgi:phosphohistidine phosphatase SixA
MVAICRCEMPATRRLLLAAVLTAPSLRAAMAEEAAWQALRGGGIALFRHAIAPGGGDPPGMRLGDCSTQRNLDAAGREQARRIGAAFRAEGVAVDAVLASAWCRTRETAELAFPGRAAVEPAFNSFFADRGEAAARTEAARAILLAWRGPGALVVSTHQVNITALTGIFPASGEGVVLRREGDALAVAGRIRV